MTCTEFHRGDNVQSLLLDSGEEEARETFVRWIHDSLNCKTTQLNNAIHIWAH